MHRIELDLSLYLSQARLSRISETATEGLAFSDCIQKRQIAYPATSACSCCGDDRLRKIGEDVTETLEFIPRQWSSPVMACWRALVLNACPSRASRERVLFSIFNSEMQDPDRLQKSR